MATDLGRAKSPASNKHDIFVAGQLAQAEKRIRLLDLTAALLGFAALGLAYVVGMVVCDSKLELTSHARQLWLYAFLAGGVLYLLFTVVRPLRLRVNPYYAARQVERQLPGAKNSIVNWVDLHQQPLPPAIRGALGQRAAKDLSRVDLDRAISGRRAMWMGGLAGLFALAFVVAFFRLGPSPFFSLLRRTFNPFGQVSVSTRTQLSLVKPEGGDAVVTVGRGIGFVVEVSGKVPDAKAADAVKLLYRYEENDPWLERLLVPESHREWTASLSALEVKNGFWYRVTGGDAATEEHRVRVRAAPAVTDFLATYHYRPYVARAEEVRHERELKALRGTTVVLRVRTNRALREGRLEFEGKEGAKIVRGTLAPDDPNTLLVTFLLDEDGKYRLHFTSTDSEAYADPGDHPVTAIPDNPPAVELTKPGQDIRLPADALLPLEGKANDDIGVKSLMLHMQVVGGERLREQPYRSDAELRLADGGYPREVEYKDFVELSRVKGQNGQALPLRAGMELEYWLEAADACDYPRPNVAESKHYRVMLTEPEKNAAKRQQEKQQAERDKKQQQNKQDKKLQQEAQDRQQERDEQEARNKAEQERSNQADKSAAGDKAEPKEGDKSESKDDKGARGETNNAEPSKEQQDLENKVKDALERKEQDAKGEAKPDKGEQGEKKGAGQNNPNGDKQAGEKPEGQGKGADPRAGNQAGEGKDKGQPQPGAEPSPGEGKGDSQPKPMAGDKGEAKGGAPMNPPGAGEAGEGKGQPNQGTPNSKPQEGGAAGPGDPQPMGQQAGPEESKGGQGKDDKSKGEAKGASDGKDGDKAEVKKGNSGPMGDPAAAGESKPSGDKPEGENPPRGESKPDAGARSRNATPQDVENLAKGLQSGDPKERQEAKRRLEQIQKQARDPMAREKAEQTLDQAGQPDGEGGKQPKPGDGSAGDGSGERKDGKGDGSKDGGASKPGSGSKSPGESGSESGGGGKDGKDKQGSSEDGGGASRQARDREGGNTPGGGGNRRGGENGPRGSGDGGATLPADPSKPRDHRAAQMQLEDFFQKVDKNVLKDAGVSEEAWKKYVESRRKQMSSPDKPRPDAPADPRQATTLPSIGGRPIPSSPSAPGDVHGPDCGQPPPGYRDPFREFNRKMNGK